MTFTYELDLDILPLDLHIKNQVCMFVRSAVRVVTDTHRRCQNYYTPSLTRGVMMAKRVVLAGFF